jgi:hypothetical protein
MKKHLLATVAVLAMTTASHAVTITVNEAQTDLYTNVNGGLNPTISNATGLPTETLTKGGPSVTFNLFTLTPPGSSCNSLCVTDQGNPNSVDRGTFNVTLTLTETGGATASVGATGYYEAKYYGSHLLCDISGSSPPGQSDCLDWNGYGDTSSYTTTATFTNGDRMAVTFNQGSDWSMTPTVTLSALAVPGPLAGAGLPGLVAGCFGLLGLNRQRRRRQLV